MDPVAFEMRILNEYNVDFSSDNTLVEPDISHEFSKR